MRLQVKGAKLKLKKIRQDSTQGSYLERMLRSHAAQSPCHVCGDGIQELGSREELTEVSVR